MIVAVTKVAIKIPLEIIFCFELDCVLLARFEKIKPAPRNSIIDFSNNQQFFEMGIHLYS